MSARADLKDLRRHRVPAWWSDAAGDLRALDPGVGGGFA